MSLMRGVGVGVSIHSYQIHETHVAFTQRQITPRKMVVCLLKKIIA